MYNNNLEKYKLNKDVTQKLLIKNGFNANGVFKCFVYKNIIQLIIEINIEEGYWNYSIYDIDTKSIYPPYYDRSCGKHLHINYIDEQVDAVLSLMVKNKILTRRIIYNGKKDS